MGNGSYLEARERPYRRAREAATGPRRRISPAGAWLAVLALGCAHAPATPGMPPLASPLVLPAHPFKNMLAVEAEAARSVHDVILDTGAPWFALDLRAFAAVPPSAAAVASGLDVRLGGLVLADQRYQTMPVCASTCVGMPAGALPVAALSPNPTTLDYRGRTVTIGRLAQAPSTVLVQARVAGSPPTRFLVDVMLEGDSVPVPAVLDTGSTNVGIRSQRMDALLADGRAHLAVQSMSGLGEGTSRITRLRSVSVGAARSTGVPVQSGPTIDQFLDGVSKETRTHVEAVLAGSFLRDYVVTIDYAAPSLALAPPKSDDPLEDEFVRAGVSLRALEDGTFRIARASDPTAAPLIDTTLESVDGKPVHGTAIEDADRMLRGPLGATRTLVTRSPRGGEATTTALTVKQTLPSP